VSGTLDSIAPCPPVVGVVQHATGLAPGYLGSPTAGSHVLESQTLAADATPVGSAPSSPIEASLSGVRDIDGAASSVGSRAAATKETGPGPVPSSMGCTSNQMGEDSGCTMPFSALPQDLVPLQEVGSPPATGALLHGPSAPTIVFPHVAQAPCSTIQVYSHRQKKRSENNAADNSPVQDFIAELIKPVGGLVPRLISKRRAKRLLADFVPRCSTRLAKNRAGATSAATRHIQ
jgi:hypothetical protein